MAKKADANQAEIVEALRAVGCSVLDLHHVGHGCPDILVGRCGEDDYLIEIKAKGGGLERAQLRFAALWRGRPVQVVWDVDGALRAVGIRVTNAALEMD
ncbi:MAG: hypothetical protein V2A73_08775 [Pseudomonadota bacterium]